MTDGLKRPSANRQRCSRESEQARKCNGCAGLERFDGEAAVVLARAKLLLLGRLEELVVDRSRALQVCACSGASRSSVGPEPEMSTQ